jgi:DNA-directed RNA polymerase specialized sigma24 family protein
VLYELEGLTGPEIAQALGCPLKTVWTRLHHARKEFEKAVKRHG